MKTNNSIVICQSTEADFIVICNHIKLFDLDNRDLKFEQFLVAKQNNKLIGFGRIRKHNGCDEFCSLGVIKAYRYKGIAKLLINARIQIATQPIYLVCIIPNYFIALGFKVVTKYPPQILDKLNYCTNELVVPENYVVMRFGN